MLVRVDEQLIDSILEPWRPVLANDYLGYRNHVIRMATFCLNMKNCNAEEKRKIELAACFHDLGIWSNNTMDYLNPSVRLANEYLTTNGLDEWAEEIEMMILCHHKLLPLSGSDMYSTQAELFRKGDLVDVSWGLVKYKLKSSDIKEIQQVFPNRGFHKNLLRMMAKWIAKHPLNPLPMLKW